MTEFQGKTVMITGGGTGIGLATARRLVSDGANVVIAGRRKLRLDAAVGSLDAGDRVLAVVTDVARPDDLDALMWQTRERFGRLDGLFANAGTIQFARGADVTAATFDQLMDVNVKGVYFTVTKALPLFDGGGAVVLNGSWLAHRGMGFATVYAASKAAVINLARTLAADLADRSIRVNAISPGYIVTDMFDGIATTEQEREYCRGHVPLGRLGRPEDVAEVAAFLLSARSSYVTGQELAVDGGLTTSIPV